jgi:hypothetical protein
MNWRYVALTGWFVVLIIFISGGSYKEKFVQVSNQETVPDHNQNIVVSLPDKLEFAGEEVPLKYFDVKESLDRELHVNTYFQSQTIFFLKRANRFFPMIEPILKKNGVPSDFKYMAVAESGLTNAISPLQAVGFWQILEPTAKEYGLEINDEVDERFNIEKSTEVACRFLKEAYQQFGSWAMAAASYNMGRQAMLKTVERQQEKNYYNLYLNDETARYMYRVLAIKLVLENPQQYGFKLNKKEIYQPYEYSEVLVNSSISSIADFARSVNTNYKILKIFNPWLRNGQLTNKLHKTYVIKIPSPTYRETVFNEPTDTLKTQ